MLGYRSCIWADLSVLGLLFKKKTHKNIIKQPKAQKNFMWLDLFFWICIKAETREPAVITQVCGSFPGISIQISAVHRPFSTSEGCVVRVDLVNRVWNKSLRGGRRSTETDSV